MRRTVLLGLGLAACLAAGAVAVTGCSTGANAVDETTGNGDGYVAGNGQTTVYRAGQRPAAPAVTGTSLDGAGVSLASYRGKVLVINFWAEWCAPCVLEAADLEATYQATAASGVAFLGVNSEDEKDKALAFQHGRLTYPSLFDPSGHVAMLFRNLPSTLPATLIIDRSGRVAAVIRSAVNRDDLTRLVDQIAAEPT